MARIRGFFCEINTCDISHENTDKAITFENVDLGWSNESKMLKDMSFQIDKGELIAEVGSVGAGKSRFLFLFILILITLNQYLNSSFLLDSKTKR